MCIFCFSTSPFEGVFGVSSCQSLLRDDQLIDHIMHIKYNGPRLFERSIFLAHKALPYGLLSQPCSSNKANMWVLMFYMWFMKIVCFLWSLSTFLRPFNGNDHLKEAYFTKGFQYFSVFHFALQGDSVVLHWVSLLDIFDAPAHMDPHVEHSALFLWGYTRLRNTWSFLTRNLVCRILV